MIKIKKSINFVMSREGILFAARKHIKDVQKAVAWMCVELYERGKNHDHTKIEYVDELHRDLRHWKGDYKKGNWFQNHHLTERHHLEEKCPSDVNMFDVMERIADVCVSAKAVKGEVYDDLIDPQMLVQAYENTIDLLCKEIEVQKV